MVDRYATTHLEIHKSESLPERKDMGRLLRDWGLATLTQESFWVIAYDASMNVRTVVEVCKGNYATVPIHLPSLFSAVLLSGADRFVCAHNHPTGNVQPTNADRETTSQIMEGANQLGLFFEDHLIVSPRGRLFSFAEAGLMKPAPYTGKLNA